MNLTYKKATENDLPIISFLAEKIWKRHYVDIISGEQIEYMLNKMYSLASLRDQMQNGHQFTLAYFDGSPVGYMSLSTRDEKNYFLHKFYVEVDEQSKGIGTQFLNYVISSLNDPKTIELTVNRQNFKAVNFYFKNGFIIREVADFDIGNAFVMNDFIMVKKIKK
ncbi:MAG: GCN5-related N-acetyltransferase [Bacteroidota bacterium]|jgi:GNAT superfamily N-acetyltransferase|nr:GCN5-related N-acetyltransferase [Bacteroidota bacterium]